MRKLVLAAVAATALLGMAAPAQAAVQPATAPHSTSGTQVIHGWSYTKQNFTTEAACATRGRSWVATTNVLAYRCDVEHSGSATYWELFVDYP